MQQSILGGCISFDSYIKPQPAIVYTCNGHVVYLLIPTSNHNQWVERTAERHVVYLLIPTSNHNNVSPATDIQWLYIF